MRVVGAVAYGLPQAHARAHAQLLATLLRRVCGADTCVPHGSRQQQRCALPPAHEPHLHYCPPGSPETIPTAAAATLGLWDAPRHDMKPSLSRADLQTAGPALHAAGACYQGTKTRTTSIRSHTTYTVHTRRVQQACLWQFRPTCSTTYYGAHA